jgi:hypothetical protein
MGKRKIPEFGPLAFRDFHHAMTRWTRRLRVEEMQMSRLRFKPGRGSATRWLAALAAVAVLGLSSAAQANPVQFAGYTQTTSTSPVTFNNTTGDITAGPAGSQVSFTFTNVVGGGALDPVLYSGAAATLHITVTGAGNVLDLGPAYYETYSSATITLTSNNAIGSHAAGSNLLTVQIGNVGSILALKNTLTPNYSGSSDTGETDIKYTSDFVNFATTYKASFNIGFILQQALGIGPNNNHFSNNTASSGGQFSAEPPPSVPEPTSIALVGLGLIGIPVVLRRRRQASV